jgi:hypothetical protein
MGSYFTARLRPTLARPPQHARTYQEVKPELQRLTSRSTRSFNDRDALLTDQRRQSALTTPRIVVGALHQRDAMRCLRRRNRRRRSAARVCGWQMFLERHAEDAVPTYYCSNKSCEAEERAA